MTEFSSKIGLGTAQWGLPYGISNKSGQTSRDEVTRILEYAKASGIKVIDTARAYGQAERVLGSNDLSGFNVITKLPALYDLYSNRYCLDEWLEVSFSKSLDALNADNVQGLLIHNCDDLFSQSGVVIARFLRTLKSLGKCRQIGVSVYSSVQIMKILDIFIPDIIQLPFNVFDQRLLHDGTLSTLKELGIEIHARSIFLQGLLLMSIEDLPSYFTPWMHNLAAWHKFCEDLGLPPQHVALNYVVSNNCIDQAIVGVDSLSQLVELLSFPACTSEASLFDAFSLGDPGILNPATWPLKT